MRYYIPVDNGFESEAYQKLANSSFQWDNIFLQDGAEEVYYQTEEMDIVPVYPEANMTLVVDFKEGYRPNNGSQLATIIGVPFLQDQDGKFYVAR